MVSGELRRGRLNFKSQWMEEARSNFRFHVIFPGVEVDTACFDPFGPVGCAEGHDPICLFPLATLSSNHRQEWPPDPTPALPRVCNPQPLVGPQPVLRHLQQEPLSSGCMRMPEVKRLPAGAGDWSRVGVAVVQGVLIPQVKYRLHKTAGRCK